MRSPALPRAAVPLAKAEPPRRARRTVEERGAFPVGDVFRPLLADPKQPQFFVSLNRFNSEGASYTLASVGFGETFGLYRFSGSREGNGLQLGLVGAIFAQFNLSTASYDLVNADYAIGIPVTFRHGDTSLRFRLYHQSSHLGDELLLGGNPPERVNLSFEAVELILSQEWRGWRVYGGGEVPGPQGTGRPDAVERPLGTGVSREQAARVERPAVGGIDMKSLEEHDWAIDTSVKAGLEFGHPDPGHRRLRLMAVWYRGFDPRGQFYANEVEYYGLELSLGF